MKPHSDIEFTAFVGIDWSTPSTTSACKLRIAMSGNSPSCRTALMPSQRGQARCANALAASRWRCAWNSLKGRSCTRCRSTIF